MLLPFVISLETSSALSVRASFEKISLPAPRIFSTVISLNGSSPNWSM